MIYHMLRVKTLPGLWTGVAILDVPTRLAPVGELLSFKKEKRKGGLSGLIRNTPI
jgi:hypothetical protein